MSGREIAIIKKVAPEPTAFEVARQRAQDDATLSLAISMLEVQEQAVGRARSLLATSLALEAGKRQANKVEVARTLSRAVVDLQAIVAEIGE